MWSWLTSDCAKSQFMMERSPTPSAGPSNTCKSCTSLDPPGSASPHTVPVCSLMCCYVVFQGPRDFDEKRTQQSSGLVESGSTDVRHAHGSGQFNICTFKRLSVSWNMNYNLESLKSCFPLCSHHSLVKTGKKPLTRSWSVNSVCHPTSHKKLEISWNGYFLFISCLFPICSLMFSCCAIIQLDIWLLVVVAVEKKRLVTAGSRSRRCHGGAGKNQMVSAYQGIKFDAIILEKICKRPREFIFSLSTLCTYISLGWRECFVKCVQHIGSIICIRITQLHIDGYPWSR